MVSDLSKLLTVCIPQKNPLLRRFMSDLTLIYSPYISSSSIFLIEGSSAGIEDTELCYGRRFKLPFDYMPPVFRGQIYFTPSNGGSRKLVMDNGEVSSFWSYNFTITNIVMTSMHSKIWNTTVVWLFF